MANRTDPDLAARLREESEKTRESPYPTHTAASDTSRAARQDAMARDLTQPLRDDEAAWLDAHLPEVDNLSP